MSNNLDIYERVRKVPNEAQRKIEAGRLKGKTDINPMWRIKILTDVFGPCGIGWKTVIKNKWLESGANGEVAAFVDIDLYVRDSDSGEWSEAIPGTGGSMFISAEKDKTNPDKVKLYTDDEAYKKAYTDAISVACKALGIGADVYWIQDTTKYNSSKQGEESGGKGGKQGEEGGKGGEQIAEEVTAPTLEEAMKMTTTKGSKLSDLTEEQLKLAARVVDNKDLALAAQVILKHREEVEKNGVVQE